jgi:hypothetical protein
MTRHHKNGSRRPPPPSGLIALAMLVVGGLLLASAPVGAQGFKWPWQEDDPPPVPREPVYRPPGEYGPQPVPQPGPGAWQPGGRSNICLQLEQRLVQEGQRGSSSRDMLPQIDTEIRETSLTYRAAESQLERSDCYEYFLFSKTLRSTRKCRDLAVQSENAKRRLNELESQRQNITSASNQSYQDEIVRELARNRCGAAYEQQARRRDNPFSSLWQDDEGETAGGIGSYSNLPFATYRTLCVRLCDGYYFPISFSTLPNHFQRDSDLCQSKCAAPVSLYYHQNPGGAVDQMVAAGTNEPYTQLKTAFRYRKEFVSGCSCKQAEFVPQSTAPQQQGETTGDGDQQRAEAPPGDLPWQAQTQAPR